MKNKKIIFITLVVILILAILIIFLLNKTNVKKIGNNSTSQEIVDYILNISSYEAKIEVEVKSNKNTNKYILKQQYISPDVATQEVLEPSNISGIKIIKKGNDLKTLLFAPHEGKLFIWNITQSITQGRTIIDKVIPYTWRNENGGACYNEMYLQNNNILLARVDPFPINDADATLLFYQKRTLDTNKALKNYAIYKQTIKNREAPIIPEDFFASADAFKPDGTKIVQVMGHLPQLNILDFETGQVVGYRMEGGDDFSVFQGKKNIKNYYVEVQADDNYIYALDWGRDRWGMYEIPCVNTIHVFDWYGRLVQKLETDYDIDKMFLDTVRNRLYVTRPKSDDVYYLDLDEVFD